MNKLQITYVGSPQYRTQKMFEEIKNHIYKKGHDVCSFAVRENEEIVVEVVAHAYDDTLDLAIEWRKTSPYRPLECSLADYANDKEILSALEYVRQCAEDEMYPIK